MAAETAKPIHVTEGGRKALERFHRELINYCRQLPQLLEEGEEGRHAVLQGENILGTWDTYRDASQYAHLALENQHFMIQRIDSRPGKYGKFVETGRFSPGGTKLMPVLSDRIVGDGALVEVRVGLSQQEIRKLRKAGSPIPQPVSLQAPLDTGADLTCVDANALAGLSLPAGGAVVTNIPALGGSSATVLLDASVRIIHPSGDPRQELVISDLLIAVIPLGALTYQALVGRDILDRCRFVYDGPTGKFELHY